MTLKALPLGELRLIRKADGARVIMDTTPRAWLYPADGPAYIEPMATLGEQYELDPDQSEKEPEPTL